MSILTRNDPEPASAPKSTRLTSLDAFRGLTIAGMIVVNNPGSGKVYPPLRHAEWHGWTPTDLIFPSFLFIVGVAIPLALGKRRRGGLGRGDHGEGIASVPDHLHAWTLAELVSVRQAARDPADSRRAPADRAFAIWRPRCFT